VLSYESIAARMMREGDIRERWSVVDSEERELLAFN